MVSMSSDRRSGSSDADAKNGAPPANNGTAAPTASTTAMMASRPGSHRRHPAAPASLAANGHQQNRIAANHEIAYLYEEYPNQIVYRKMEHIVEKMQDESSGVAVKTVKSFMNTIPSVFSGADLVAWMLKNLDIIDQIEALHLGHLIAAHGYFFPVEDHVLTVKNDGTLYRFQTPYFWPSNCWEPDNTEYAVYLCKRTMQNKARLELADYEAENLARLQKMFSRKWEFIFMQAEAQSRVDKKRDKLERKVLDSQERAFWDVHRPVPGCVNTTEIDIKKACRLHRPTKNGCQIPGFAAAIHGVAAGDPGSRGSTSVLQKEIDFLRKKLARTNVKVSKVAESFISFYEQYADYDPLLATGDWSNPWITETTDFWEQDRLGKDIQTKRVRRWGFSLQELLKDPVGHEHFTRFLEKEFSSENLKFWEAVQSLKCLPSSKVSDRAWEIWNEFLGPDATCPVNVDSKSHEATRLGMDKPDRWTFDRAAAHVYHLMRSDSYSRYLRSETYKEILTGSKQKTSARGGLRAIVPFTTKKEGVAVS